MKTSNNSNENFVPVEIWPPSSDIDPPKFKSPYQFRREYRWANFDEKTRLAIVLHCLNGYPASAAYAIAFNFRGSHKSLGPLASRFFSNPRIREICTHFVHYYDLTSYHTNSKYWNG